MSFDSINPSQKRNADSESLKLTSAFASVRTLAFHNPQLESSHEAQAMSIVTSERLDILQCAALDQVVLTLTLEYIFCSHSSCRSAISCINRGWSTWFIALRSGVRYWTNLVGPPIRAEREKAPLDALYVRFLHLLNRERGGKRPANGSDLSILRWCLCVMSPRRRSRSLL